MKKLIIILSIFSVMISCEEDESNKAEIIDFSITAISNSDLVLEDIFIETENNNIFIFFNNNLNNHTFPLTLTSDIKMSSKAKTVSSFNGELIFSNADQVIGINIEAEDGTTKNWYIYLIHQQLQNSNFDTWFDNRGQNGEIYKEIGTSSVTSVWSTANTGTSIYGLYGTQPINDETNKLVEISTGETLNLPITAGTLFSGVFSFAEALANPTDPEQATIFGTPFIFRPKGFRFKYKYQSGARYIQATPKNPSSVLGGFNVTDISGEDKCSIYAFLEIRDGEKITEIARVKMESVTTADILADKEMIFPYTSTENPTHITIVFSSSTDGAEWRGAVGSTLVIDDLELIYE